MKRKRTVPHGVLTFAGLVILVMDVAHARELTFEDRVRAQTAIEQVYWSHRIWPKENPAPKPALDPLMPEAAIRAKVSDYLKKSAALETFWKRPIAPEWLQAEMDRMARHTREPRVLQELFAALGDDPLLIAECLAKPLLVDRLIRTWYSADREWPDSAAPRPTRAHEPEASPEESFDAWWQRVRTSLPAEGSPAPTYPYTEPSLATAIECANDTWTPTRYGSPDSRNFHTSIWTGTEMIVWGGTGQAGQLPEQWRSLQSGDRQLDSD